MLERYIVNYCDIEACHLCTTCFTPTQTTMRAVVALLLLAIVSVCFADSVTFARKHTELIQIHSHLSKLEIRLTKEVSVAKRIVQRKREAHRVCFILVFT